MRYEYGQDGNVSKLLTRSEDRVFMEYEYSYDGNGNRTEKTGAVWDGQQDKKESIRFRYDQKNQLLEERYGEESICYGYDPVGNRIWQEQGGESFVFEYNARNQLIERKGEAGFSFYQYDRQGNLLEEWSGEQQRTVYRYDPLNRQQEVIKADGMFQRNCYDAEDLRAEIEENGRLSRFIFHQGEIVNEERGENQLVSYLRGHGVEYLEQEGERFSFQKDEQFSTVFLLDREHEIQSCYAYDSFGNVRGRQGSVENRILYTGQQYDGVTEQYYLRARYYNPVIGRFIQEDPYRGDGLNLYAYCANNPVRYFDPSGYSENECNIVLFRQDIDGNIEPLMPRGPANEFQIDIIQEKIEKDFYDSLREKGLTEKQLNSFLNNTGLPYDDTIKFFNHIFFTEHTNLVDSNGRYYYSGYFDPHMGIAYGVNKAFNQKLSKEEINWFKELFLHEIKEGEFMSEGMPYRNIETVKKGHTFSDPPGAHDKAPAPPSELYPDFTPNTNFY